MSASRGRTIPGECDLSSRILVWGASEEDLSDEVACEYDGRVVVGHDLGMY